MDIVSMEERLERALRRLGADDEFLRDETRPARWAESLVADLSSWDFLMELLDRNYPESTFPTLPDDEARDPGPRIISLIRRINEIRERL